MKKRLLSVILLSMSAIFTPAVFAADACETVLCLYGKMTGSSAGNECHAAEQIFFNIVKKNRHGFNPSRTADARKAFLLECKSADPVVISRIISKFGRARH